VRTVLGVLSADGKRAKDDETVGGVAEEQKQLKQIVSYAMACFRHYGQSHYCALINPSSKSFS
jgi:hypothetical protein